LVSRIAEGACDVFGGAALDQKSAQSLVLAVFRQARLEEESTELA
jgi:hypothetical protein